MRRKPLVVSPSMESKQIGVDRVLGSSKREGFTRFVKCRSVKRDVSEDSSSTLSPDTKSVDNSADGAEEILPIFPTKLGDIVYQCKWIVVQTRGSKPAARFNHGATVVGRKLLVIGGENRSEIRNDVQMLDLGKLSWCKIGVGDSAPSNGLSVKTGPAQELPFCRGHSLITWGKTVILIGGQMDPPQEKITVWSFDLEMDCWTTVATKGEVPTARWGQTVNRAGSILILFGGEDAKGRKLNDLYILDLKSLMWLPLNPTGKGPSPRTRHVADMYDDRFLLIFGGETKSKLSNDIYALDFENMDWSKRKSKGVFPACRAGHAGALVGDKWYIAGGESRGSGLLDTIMLDISRMEWSVVAPASQGSLDSLQGHSVVFVQRKEKKFLVAFGGGVPVGGGGVQASSALQILQIPQDKQAPHRTLRGLLEMPTSPDSQTGGRNVQPFRTQPPPSYANAMGSSIPCACVAVSRTNLMSVAEHRISSQRSTSRSMSDYSADLDRDSGLISLRKKYAINQSSMMDGPSQSGRIDGPSMRSTSQRSTSLRSAMDAPAKRAISRSSSDTIARRTVSHISSWDSYSSSRRSDLDFAEQTYVSLPPVAGIEGREMQNQSESRFRGDLLSTESSATSAGLGLLSAEELQITPPSVRPGLISSVDDDSAIFLEVHPSVTSKARSCDVSPLNSEFSGYAETFVSEAGDECISDQSIGSSIGSGYSNISPVSPEYPSSNCASNRTNLKYPDDGSLEFAKGTDSDCEHTTVENRTSTDIEECEPMVMSKLCTAGCAEECTTAISNLQHHYNEKLATAFRTSELLAAQFIEALGVRDDTEMALHTAIQSRLHTEGSLSTALKQIKYQQDSLLSMELALEESNNMIEDLKVKNMKMEHDLALKRTVLEETQTELEAARGVLLGEVKRAFQLQVS